MARHLPRNDSVIVSLQELRRIEEERIREEAESRRRRELERQQRQREQEAARIHAERERARQRHELEQPWQEEQSPQPAPPEAAPPQAPLVLPPAELALSPSTTRRRPARLAFALGLLLLAAGGLLFSLYTQYQRQMLDLRALTEQKVALQKQLESTIGELETVKERHAAVERTLRLLRAESASRAARRDAERAAAAQAALRAATPPRGARARRAAARRRAENRGRRPADEAGPRRRRPPAGIDVKCDPNDPLCGL
jgi:hypothetical protein